MLKINHVRVIQLRCIPFSVPLAPAVLVTCALPSHGGLRDKIS